MPITVLKEHIKEAKVEPVEIPEVKTHELSDEELADLYGETMRQVERIQKDPAFTRMKLVSDELMRRLSDVLEPMDEASIEGSRYLLEVGPCSRNPRKIKEGGMEMIRMMLGSAPFMKLIKINIGDLDKYLTPGQVEVVVESDNGYSARRSIKVKEL